jgi:hypothetical protein
MKTLLSNLAGALLCCFGVHRWLRSTMGAGKVCLKCGKVVRVLLAFACLGLCSCAHTIVREKGAIVLHTQANMTDVEFRTAGGTVFKAKTVNHSTPTRAGGAAAGTWLSGIAGIIATWFAGGAAVPK